MLPLNISVAFLALLASSCASDTASVSAGEEPSPCETKLYQLASSGVLDANAEAAAVVCRGSTGVARPFSRVDVLGDDLCPGNTSFTPDYPPECQSNEDCGANEVCLCSIAFQVDNLVNTVGAYPNRCVPAECRGPKDCGGMQCGLSSDPTTDPSGLFCRTEGDECSSDIDCGQRLCVHEGDRWVCANHTPLE